MTFWKLPYGLVACLFVLSMFSVHAVHADEEADKDSSDADLTWHDDYGAAFSAARDEGKLLLVYFADKGETSAAKEFAATLQDAQVHKLCENFVLLRVTVNYEVQVGEETMPLLKHGAFASLDGKAGLAIVDLKHSERGFYGHTVSALPFEKPVYYASSFSGVKSVRTLLQLPPGTITQRTMVYAVRMHPENPASTRGAAEPYLFQEAAGHSNYQARIGVQGHQGFDARFHRINAHIGSGAASEVVAESWPGEDLLAGCFSCVHSWRQSPGHWSAVSSSQRAYGYDIKRSTSGTWYATGLFGG